MHFTQSRRQSCLEALWARHGHILFCLLQIQTEMMGDIHHYAWRARHRNQTMYINKRDRERFGDWTAEQCAVRQHTQPCAVQHTSTLQALLLMQRLHTALHSPSFGLINVMQASVVLLRLLHTSAVVAHLLAAPGLSVLPNACLHAFHHCLACCDLTAPSMCHH